MTTKFYKISLEPDNFYHLSLCNNQKDNQCKNINLNQDSNQILQYAIDLIQTPQKQSNSIFIDGKLKIDKLINLKSNVEIYGGDLEFNQARFNGRKIKNIIIRNCSFKGTTSTSPDPLQNVGFITIAGGYNNTIQSNYFDVSIGRAMWNGRLIETINNTKYYDYPTCLNFTNNNVYSYGVGSQPGIVECGGFYHNYLRNYFQSDGTGASLTSGSWINCNIKDNWFISTTGKPYAGVAMEDWADTPVGSGIGYKNINIENNTFEKESILTLWGSRHYRDIYENINIANNSIKGNKIYLRTGSNINICNNNITTQSLIAAIMIRPEDKWLPYPYGLNNIKIQNNTINSTNPTNTGTGILLENVTNYQIKRNSFIDTPIPLNISTSSTGTTCGNSGLEFSYSDTECTDYIPCNNIAFFNRKCGETSNILIPILLGGVLGIFLINRNRKKKKQSKRLQQDFVS